MTSDPKLYPVQRPGVTAYGRERAQVREEVYMAAYEVYCHVYAPQAEMIDHAAGCRGGFSTGELTKETASPLSRLLAEAVVLAGGEHPCATLGHKWKSIGGRPCPFHEAGCGNASQAVEQCESCGEIDYGVSPGYPGHDWCASQEFNCGPGCNLGFNSEKPGHSLGSRIVKGT